MAANATDTSTNEDALETDVEDFGDVSWDEGEQVEGLDSEPQEPEAKPDDEVATEPEDEAEEESTEDVVETEEQPEESEDEEPAEADEAKVEKTSDELAREAFQQREVQRLAKERAKAEAQAKYLDGAEDNRDLAVRQLQIDAYNNRITTNTDKLQTGIDRALATIDMFQDATPEIQEELLASLDDFERMYVVKDENGDPYDVKGDVYQYLQRKADSIKRIQSLGARKQDTNKSKQKQRTLATPVRAPKKAKPDEGIDAFDEEASRW